MGPTGLPTKMLNGMATNEVERVDWYANRHELCPGQVFRTVEDEIVRLERTVPGDATKWYVADWHDGWWHYDSTLEPGDLLELIRPEDVPTARPQRSPSQGM